ncbi:squalene epoxidase [Fomitiporia mediterranea MF3/22]|uniref:squalene epoxidase n=1 Tax=Fomitiporia mediterranea (strain MF3/22) TaxID=694068 RepID=UPI0004407CDE|nr:squalene epoxidase [Fomitiporia mediterranea MF3/22]EJC99983.1 squalene epoxidase [Fomitiporia mediterranea MF3/22]
MAPSRHSYDVLIVGAGVAGCALAHGLATITSSTRSKQLRIGLLERSFAEPDRIVGELLQPGGCNALRKLGMEDCLEGIDAVPVRGYCVVNDGKQVHIPYPNNQEGRSFHHGKFIMSLRKKALAAPGVEGIEATVTSLIMADGENRVHGVRATRKGSENGEKESFFAPLVFIADGCFSNFRAEVMGEVFEKPVTRSYFVGAILKDVNLPIDKHGTVALVRGSGPVLLYQISEHDTRILIDVKTPLPADLKSSSKEYIINIVVPELPENLQPAIVDALARDRLRRMPNSFLPPVEQGGEQSKEGVILVGDSWNMRHPLTGGGMTVAFNDVVILTDLLRSVSHFDDWACVSQILHAWHWSRKPLGSTINILSIALYDLFGAEDENLEVLRVGCFKYFQLGGNCIMEPVSLLAGISHRRFLLFYHFFSVAFYAIWIMFTHVQPIAAVNGGGGGSGKVVMRRPGVEEYPWLLVKALRVFWTACVVFGPPLWSELR